MGTFLDPQRRPDKHKARIAWEHSWALDMDQNYRRGPLTLMTSIAAVFPPEAARQFASDHLLLQMEQETRLICQLQEDLARQAAIRFAEDDFEGKWLASGREKRDEIILEGIYRTMCIPDMEERRKWCPDSTLKYLSSHDGDAYLRVLKALLPADLQTTITEPAMVLHPVIDRLLSLKPADAEKPGYKTFVRMTALSRTYCLTTVIWNIFLAFHGQHEDQIPVKPPPANRKTTKAIVGTVPGDVGSNNHRIAKELYIAHNESRKDMHYSCWYCGKSSAVDRDVKLMACSKCRAIGRKVWYCSRECQVKDWKSGTPRPHKAICGKVLAEKDIMNEKQTEPVPRQSEDDSDDSDIPEPDPSFKRSPALLHQISLLRKDPQCDYVIVYPYPEPDRGVQLSHAIGKLLFRTLRARALRNGDPEAVRGMYDMLSGVAGQQNISMSQIRKQLEGEYGVTLDDSVPGNRPAFEADS